ncbi:hypothetical protein B0H16DRAFT_1789633 [Mycena metata]|uniref:Uncharacterized protein n=1 Tax=Mycena metata TaxID=1033252 RepID=A0AAD7MM40_9AGAR|nr:hypothetical protein B0H16DRAFT_1789633 [Mycena metata]
MSLCLTPYFWAAMLSRPENAAAYSSDNPSPILGRYLTTLTHIALLPLSFSAQCHLFHLDLWSALEPKEANLMTKDDQSDVDTPLASVLPRGKYRLTDQGQHTPVSDDSTKRSAVESPGKPQLIFLCRSLSLACSPGPRTPTRLPKDVNYFRDGVWLSKTQPISIAVFHIPAPTNLMVVGRPAFQRLPTVAAFKMCNASLGAQPRLFLLLNAASPESIAGNNPTPAVGVHLMDLGVVSPEPVAPFARTTT